ncbi:2-oxoacid:ferredoxin oxidoreductase subunit beta, partial [Nonomuraea wenchangensis]
NPDPSLAFALSRLDEPAFEHVPIGIFRSVDRPSYETLMAEQLDEAAERQGPGDLGELLLGGDTWRIN